MLNCPFVVYGAAPLPTPFGGTELLNCLPIFGLVLGGGLNGGLLVPFGVCMPFIFKGCVILGAEVGGLYGRVVCCGVGVVLGCALFSLPGGARINFGLS